MTLITGFLKLKDPTHLENQSQSTEQDHAQGNLKGNVGNVTLFTTAVGEITDTGQS